MSVLEYITICSSSFVYKRPILPVESLYLNRSYILGKPCLREPVKGLVLYAWVVL